MPGPGRPQGCRRPQPRWTGSEPGTTCPEEMGGREDSRNMCLKDERVVVVGQVEEKWWVDRKEE